MIDAHCKGDFCPHTVGSSRRCLENVVHCFDPHFADRATEVLDRIEAQQQSVMRRSRALAR